VKRNLKTKESRAFWAAVNKLLKGRGNRAPVHVFDPWLDHPRDLSAKVLDPTTDS
jgi:hypothetical protein